MVRHVTETGSTNADLLARAMTGDAPDRSVLVADHQTAGRGRLDRTWLAPPGANLLVSLLFATPPPVAAELTQRVGLAAVDAVGGLLDGSGPCPGLKWPNDVLLGGHKLAGILAQRAASGAVVVGMGLNVGWAPPGAARLCDHVVDDVHPATVLAAVLGALDALPDDVHGRYREALVTLDKDVRVELPGGRFLEGTAVDVDRRGRLVVADRDGERHRVDAGDVVHLRPV